VTSFRNTDRLSLARDLLARLEDNGGRLFLTVDMRYFLLDLVKAEVFKRERIEQQKADGKRRRAEIREQIGPK
jgi:hypothetical protein